VSVMEEFGNNDIGCTSLNVIIPATSYMTCIPTMGDIRWGRVGMGLMVVRRRTSSD
jgi:hypothetical protein